MWGRVACREKEEKEKDSSDRPGKSEPSCTRVENLMEDLNR